MIPVKISGCINSGLSKDEIKALPVAGIVPVNDVFYDLWLPEAIQQKVILLYGSYGSGKSIDRCAFMLNLAMSDGYFRGYFGRKLWTDVRGSVHATICDLIEDWGLQSEFKYSREATGDMTIKHRRTGNMLVPFGASDSKSLKSIKDPTHFFLEELDQFGADDFGIIVSRLRTSKAKTQLFGAFNSAAVMPGHWLLQYFFPNEAGEVEVNKKLAEAIAEVGVKTVFCNYTDNYFIDRQAYYRTLVIAAGGDESHLDAIANGKFGVPSIGLLFPLNGLRLFDMADIPQLLPGSDIGPEWVDIPVDPAGGNGGGDDLSALVGKLVGDTIYVTDVIYNTNPLDENERRICDLASTHRANSVRIENLFGWAECLARIRQEMELRNFEGEIRAITPRTNKHVRILAKAPFIRNHIAFRRDYQQFPEYLKFMRNLTSYFKVQEIGHKNAHDEAGDNLEMLSTYYLQQFGYLWPIKYDQDKAA